MKENSRLSRYKDPKKQIENIYKHNLEHYESFHFRLDKEKDKDIIEEIKNRKISLPQLIRSWYKRSKK